ncbi:MAG: nucleoside monophosphate kinase [Candidatus Absconditabacteria bacterium]|nr:nucleoside monophosphate kinase [Candidatus Absconditabacteria bacterium]
MKDIVLSGIQGSGKGTQCELLLKKFGNKISYFEAGGILRALQSKPNAIGKYIGSIIDNGNLLPDQFMVKIFDLFLFSLEQNKSILVDGFPRQIPQMHAFLEMMKTYNRDYKTIVLDISREEAIKRLTSRRMCKTCGAILNTNLHNCDKCPICDSIDIYQREDDKDIVSIETRIDLFENQTKPVIEHLQKEGVITVVNGNQSPEKVFEDIVTVIES